jgi:porphobilinogen deaminase
VFLFFIIALLFGWTSIALWHKCTTKDEYIDELLAVIQKQRNEIKEANIKIASLKKESAQIEAKAERFFLLYMKGGCPSVDAIHQSSRRSSPILPYC